MYSKSGCIRLIIMAVRKDLASMLSIGMLSKTIHTGHGLNAFMKETYRKPIILSG